jgi:hypothetical protein
VTSLSAPDAIEPVVGWRFWRVEDDRLGSLTRSTPWPSKRPFEEHCRLAVAEAYGVPVEFCDADSALSGAEDDRWDETALAGVDGPGWEPAEVWRRLAAAVRRILLPRPPAGHGAEAEGAISPRRGR